MSSVSKKKDKMAEDVAQFAECLSAGTQLWAPSLTQHKTWHGDTHLQPQYFRKVEARGPRVHGQHGLHSSSPVSKL